jgi:hypothetical protein
MYVSSFLHWRRGPDFFALALGPHPQRELSLMPRGGPRGMAAGAAVRFSPHPTYPTHPTYLTHQNQRLIVTFLSV